ncbi:hypothetical protein OSB04_018501 [Centaurea solstitialis]|uniref:HIPL1 protein n=1 Tax=Centaurea solstitialis TaxID=347529 RepID=A0AA38TFW7_9ASTR|nr:hypothetical protein OSB04_018501 [Centaurea solstitialis]
MQHKTYRISYHENYFSNLQTCDQFMANLFTVESQARSIPVLCDSPKSADSALSKQSETSFCTNVWDTCQNVPMRNSPFAPSLQGAGGLPQNTSSKLTDLWQSRNDFCTAFGSAPDESTQCFNGRPITLNSTQIPVPPRGMCLEKLGDKGYINMMGRIGPSSRTFSDLPGKIWLMTIPSHGSREPLGLDESIPFVDLTDQLKFDTVFGLMGIAFHPKFAENGRFFASFNCDKEKLSTCSGRCGCNSDVGCDPSKIGSSGRDERPCQYHNVVAEYTVNGTASDPTKVMHLRNKSNVLNKIKRKTGDTNAFLLSCRNSWNKNQGDGGRIGKLLNYPCQSETIKPSHSPASMRLLPVHRSVCHCFMGTAETPANSGNFTTTSIPFSCAHDSPLECSSVPNTNLAALGYIYSFGEDNKKNVYILASTGVYRVVRPSRCNYSCTKENATQVKTPRTSPPSSSGNHLTSQYVELVLYLSLILVLVGYMLGGFKCEPLFGCEREDNRERDTWQMSRRHVRSTADD